MKLVFIILFIMLGANSIFAQNTLLNESKYWMWRDRLVNDWMVPNFTGDYGYKVRLFVLLLDSSKKNDRYEKS